VIEALNLKDITMVGHSTGGGEVARYIGRYGTKRVASARGIAAMARLAAKSGDDGSNDLIVSAVIRRNELQVWFVAEHVFPPTGAGEVETGRIADGVRHR
jgi:pimeloyl-ACP methyl ester carboxylesterase